MTKTHLSPGQHAYLFAESHESTEPQHIYIPQPPIGNKIHLILQRGLFVLERGEGVWLGMSCTHAGSGGVVVYDGVPNDDGFFPEPPARPMDTAPPEEWLEYYKAMGCYNGRPLSYAHPASMGMHIFSGGFWHGLTVKAVGEMEATASILTFTWLVPKAKK